MPSHQVTFDLDPTGLNPSNRVENEPHVLSNRSVRSIAPAKGPFFGENCTVWNGAAQLQRGVHFQFTELHQEATLKYGKEIYSVILVIDSAIPSNVTITYQALGGHYQNSDVAIKNLYETVINDTRPVDFMLGLINKPYEYNPANHRHLLDDVYGFEPVVDYLERIKRAITLGQTDVLLAVFKALAGRFECKELPNVLPNTKFIQYDALLYFLSKRKMLSNIWIDTICCKWYKGDSAVIEIDTSGYTPGTLLYWELYVPNSSQVALFTRNKGQVAATGGTVQIDLYVPSENFVNNDRLYLGVKDNPNAHEFKAVSYHIDVVEHNSTNTTLGFFLEHSLHPNNQQTTLAQIESSNEHRLYYAMNH